ncbi:hypothetical protein CDD81_3769 [Ophiocordyceps australis]|uniref:Uncharacterized protein n=1 Tax=Ophiocordyceps australis TaxID=1399860 RepID=A0A2C5YCD0_9HYPO|nr:hypothetical protein CDD81_3769 [Ophiocordyceps australis]
MGQHDQTQQVANMYNAVATLTVTITTTTTTTITTTTTTTTTTAAAAAAAATAARNTQRPLSCRRPPLVNGRPACPTASRMPCPVASQFMPNRGSASTP